MRGSLRLLGQNARDLAENINIVQIKNGAFYLQHPSAGHHPSADAPPPLYRDLTFELPAKPLVRHPRNAAKQQHWAVIGASGTTTFLEILRGTHLCLPPTARSFPYLSSDEIEAKDHRLRNPFRAIQYVGFNAGKGQGLGGGIRGAYLSARYESRREETDWSVLQYLKGETDLNPAEDQHDKDAEDTRLLTQVMKDLRLEKMSSMPVSNLSNGQTRRARIAKALLGRPELLLLDEPFMGLDPPTLVTLSPMLRDLAYKSSPRLLLALRPQDPIPDWITHLVILGVDNTIPFMGPKAEVLFALHCWADADGNDGRGLWATRMARKMTKTYGRPLHEIGHTLTAAGITRYETYENIRSSSKYFNDAGRLRREYLSKTNQELHDKMVGNMRRQWTASQLLALTASLPVDVQDQDIAVTEHSEGAAELQDAPNTGKASRSRATVARREIAGAADSSTFARGEPLIELSGVVVKYGSKVVLGHSPPQTGHSNPGLHLTIYQNTRLALLGPNGSGKTTLLSLLTSDHPHSYSLPIKFFGRSRLPEPGKPGLSLWDIQSRVGHSSPEIHAFFPKRMSVRRVLESAWAETFAGKPKLSAERDDVVDRMLRWWEPELRQTSVEVKSKNSRRNARKEGNEYVRSVVESAVFALMSESYPSFDTAPFDPHAESPDDSLDWAEDLRMHAFGVLPFGVQRLLLLLRAVIKNPDIIILDEAFSGLSPDVREKAMCYLEHGEVLFLRRQPTATDEADSSHLVKTPNMRTTVERAFTRLESSPSILSFSHLKPEKRRILKMSRQQLVELAKVEAKEHPGPEYRFTGLSDKQALVVVSHVREEVPGIVNEWLRLPGEEEVLEQERGVEMGRCDGGSIRTVEGWSKVWNL